MIPARSVSGLTYISVLAALVAASTSSSAPATARSAQLDVPLAGIREHLAAFQRIADRNGGNRTAGTAGYDASVRYVARRMRVAGYRVRLQELAFPFVRDRTLPALQVAGGPEWRARRDYTTFQYSGSGRVEAPVEAVDLLVPVPAENTSTSGCEATDFAGFRRGSIALLQRGTCTFRVKVENARAAGASAVVVFNDGAPGRRSVFGATLGPPQAALPVLAASSTVGDALRRGVVEGPTGVIATIETDMLVERRRTANVIADTRSGDPRNTVVVGAHLDSVLEGPGINDNGSGSAMILEIAEQLARTRLRNRVRFAWWGAEELGLVGSTHYVRRLSPAERSRHALYLNLDMVGSRNFVSFVYDGGGSAGGRIPLPKGSAAIERVLVQWFTRRSAPFRKTAIGSGSDHVPFARAGIPVGGLFTGASGHKSLSEATAFGGRAERPYDPCYHRPCDTIANVSDAALVLMAGAAGHAVSRFSQDLSGVRPPR